MGPLMRRTLGRGEHDERGASAVEFALIMVPLLFLVFGIIQYSFYFYGLQAGTSATGDAVRRLAVGDCQSQTELKTFLRDRLGYATAQSANDLTTVVTFTSASSTSVVAAPGEVGGKVTLSMTFRPIDLNFPLIPMPTNGDLDRTVTARVEDTTPRPGGCS